MLSISEATHVSAFDGKPMSPNSESCAYFCVLWGDSAVETNLILATVGDESETPTVASKAKTLSALSVGSKRRRYRLLTSQSGHSAVYAYFLKCIRGNHSDMGSATSKANTTPKVGDTTPCSAKTMTIPASAFFPCKWYRCLCLIAKHRVENRETPLWLPGSETLERISKDSSRQLF